jgi:hypothetical protein
MGGENDGRVSRRQAARFVRLAPCWPLLFRIG